jgi:hypothetical protein
MTIQKEFEERISRLESEVSRLRPREYKGIGNTCSTCKYHENESCALRLVQIGKNQLPFPVYPSYWCDWYSKETYADWEEPTPATQPCSACEVECSECGLPFFEVCINDACTRQYKAKQSAFHIGK